MSLGFSGKEHLEEAEERARGMSLTLYGASPSLAGLVVSAPRLDREDRERLPLMAALWEEGRLPPDGIKIT